MRFRRGLVGIFAVALAVQVLPGVAEADIQILALSNRADLISGGDALVEIVLPDGIDAADVTVDVEGTDATGAFAVRDDGRFIGRLEGLDLGVSAVTATHVPSAAGATLDITNHSIDGPIFSGPQLEPWLCTTENAGLGAPGSQCSAPTKIEFFYRNAEDAFAPYDPANPPDDVQETTTDQGVTVPYIIRQETGVQNRGLYRVAVLYDPAQPFEPWATQAWNGKLFYPFGASCGTQYTQGSAQNVQNHNALSRGFLVATSSLNVLGNNCNTVLSAETMMMLKEHIIDRYGEIRYTFGSGGSGGSIGQNMVANSYPGLLDGITETAVFADTVTTGSEVFDCHLLFNYFTQVSPHLWLNPAQQIAVTGHGTSPATCAGWELFFASVEDPTTGCGLPAEQTYHPQDNPTGARCAYQDFERNVWGLRTPDLWGPVEQQIEQGFAKKLYDNVGVTYGLNALRQGLITTEQFVDLNQKIGAFDVDFEFTDERASADPGVVEIAYRSGRINDGGQLDQVPIIDTRGTGNIDPLTIHTMHHSFALKQRIANAHGTSANHVVWRGGSPAGGAFDAMDAWLAAVEEDDSEATLAEKIIANKPPVAEDTCWVGDQSFSDEATCDVIWPYYGAPRIAAGAPMTHDLYKCQLRPLDRNDDWGPVPFTDLQWERLVTAFPDGVCDWTLPSVDRVPSVPWLSYAGGSGGVPMGPAPASTPV